MTDGAVAGTRPWWRCPAPWVGLAAGLTMAAGRLVWLAGSPEMAGNPVTERILEVLGADSAGPLSVLGVCLFLMAWMLLKPQLRLRRPGLLPTLLIWIAPLLPLGGILSSDPRYYADIGWLINNGHDPYTTGLGTTGGPFPVGDTWRGTTAVYPAVALRLFAWVVHLTGTNWYWSVVGMRALALIGVGLVALSMPTLARRAGVDLRAALWLALFNPVTIVHGIGGAHIDMLMCGALAAAVAVALRTNSLLLGALLVGLAGAIKQPALIGAVPVALLTGSAAPTGRWREWGRVLARTALAVVVALGSMVGFSYLAGFGMGWIQASQDLYRVKTVGLGYLVGSVAQAVAAAGGHPLPDVINQSVRVTGLVALAAVAVAFVVWRRRPWLFAVVAALLWAVAGGVFREWYVLLPVIFLPLAQPGPALRRWMSLLVPFAATSSAFKSYLDWTIVNAFYASAAIAVAANASGWLIGAVPPAATVPDAAADEPPSP